jgi:hypothetical protein
MTRLLSAAADRLLLAVAPKAEAAAACNYYFYICDPCRNGVTYCKRCYLDYYCAQTCGPRQRKYC